MSNLVTRSAFSLFVWCCGSGSRVVIRFVSVIAAAIVVFVDNVVVAVYLLYLVLI